MSSKEMPHCTPEVPVSHCCCSSSLTGNRGVYFSCLMQSAYTVLPGVLCPCTDLLRGAHTGGSNHQDLSSALWVPCLLHCSPEALSSEQSTLLFSSKTFYLLEVTKMWKKCPFPEIQSLLFQHFILYLVQARFSWGIPLHKRTPS